MIVIGADVGTSSVRLAVIDYYEPSKNNVKVLASQSHPITVHQDGVKFEQNSEEIWQAICICSKQCLARAKINPHHVESIGFSATCSLVLVEQDEFKNNSTTENNVIMWLDHRALDIAESITANKEKCLDLFGGVCSPEFSLAKYLWVQKHESARFEACKGFFELPDWLAYRCLGSKVNPKQAPRSACCLTCKWAIEKEQKISDKIGATIMKPGTISGFMCDEAMIDLGLLDLKDNSLKTRNKILVATSMIDAHAGMLAMLSANWDNKEKCDLENILCSLAGTSTCHMALQRERVFTYGIWGPYKDVVLDDYYLHEAGQSMTGKLIEYIIQQHPSSKDLLARDKMDKVIGDLNGEIAKKKGLRCKLHILPTFHGSRTPVGTLRSMGAIYGLRVDQEADLLDYYMSTVESLAYETKAILNCLHHVKVSAVLVSGGLKNNNFFLQTLANILSIKVIKLVSQEVDFMVLGAGLLARQASLKNVGADQDQSGGMKIEMLNQFNYDNLTAETFMPNYDNLAREYYEDRFDCYMVLVEASQKIDAIQSKTQGQPSKSTP